MARLHEDGSCDAMPVKPAKGAYVTPDAPHALSPFQPHGNAAKAWCLIDGDSFLTVRAIGIEDKPASSRPKCPPSKILEWDLFSSASQPQVAPGSRSQAPVPQSGMPNHLGPRVSSASKQDAEHDYMIAALSAEADIRSGVANGWSMVFSGIKIMLTST